MDFALTEEQRMIVKTTRDFVENELFPHEAEVERTGELRKDLRDELKAKAIEAGLYAANMPAEAGGAGLDTADLGASMSASSAAPTTRCTGIAWRGPPTS